MKFRGIKDDHEVPGSVIEGESILQINGRTYIEAGNDLNLRLLNGHALSVNECDFIPVISQTVEVIDNREQDRKYDRNDYLSHADSVINGERQNLYGDPEDNFGAIASFWTTYLGGQVLITPEDVACMMTLMKIARIASGTMQRDSFIDAIGYMALGGEIAERPQP